MIDTRFRYRKNCAGQPIRWLGAAVTSGRSAPRTVVKLADSTYASISGLTTWLSGMFASRGKLVGTLVNLLAATDRFLIC